MHTIRSLCYGDKLLIDYNLRRPYITCQKFLGFDVGYMFYSFHVHVGGAPVSNAPDNPEFLGCLLAILGNFLKIWKISVNGLGSIK